MPDTLTATPVATRPAVARSTPRRGLHRWAYLGLTVGRHPALCERILADDSVSRRHFRIGIADGKLFVEDLNSLNGTFLDDRELPPFQPTPLLPGQEIQAGRVSLAVSRLDDR